MNTTMMDPKDLLEKAMTLAATDANLEMMDFVTRLRGYIGLAALVPENVTFQREAEEAAQTLLAAAERHAPWHALLDAEAARSSAA
jgi:hypothetical protein